MKRILLMVLFCFLPFFCFTNAKAADQNQDNKFTLPPAHNNPKLISITEGYRITKQIPCERIEIFSAKSAPVDKAGVRMHRAEVNTGRTKNGDIYAAIVGTKSVYKSKDGGKKWMRMPLPPMEDYMCAFTVLQDDSFLFLRRGPQPVLHTVPAALIWHSTDYGKTWYEFSAISPCPFDGMCEGLQSFTQLKDGTILFPTCMWKNEPLRYNEPAGTGGRENVVFFSKDSGKTWREKAKTFDYVGEPQIIELQSGKLLGAFRYQRRPLPSDTPESVKKWNGEEIKDPNKSIFKQIFIGESLDKGKTWVNLRPVQDKDGNALLIFGECHGQLVQVQDGRVVLVHDHRYPYETSQIMARVSEDEGNTWSKGIYRVSFGAGYPSSVVLEDGTIVTVTGSTIAVPGRPSPTDKWDAVAIRWKLPPKQ